MKKIKREWKEKKKKKGNMLHGPSNRAFRPSQHFHSAQPKLHNGADRWVPFVSHARLFSRSTAPERLTPGTRGQCYPACKLVSRAGQLPAAWPTYRRGPLSGSSSTPEASEQTRARKSWCRPSLPRWGDKTFPWVLHDPSCAES
jgi:hypothetical protein